MKIRLYNAKITAVTFYPGTDGNTAVGVIQFPMTKALAEDLKCKGLLYDDNDLPRNFAGSVSLPLQIDDSDIYIGQRNAVHSGKLWKFKITHEEKENEIRLVGSARLHVSKDRMALLGIADELGKDETTVEIDTAQQDFGFMKSETEIESDDTEDDPEQEPLEDFQTGEVLEETKKKLGRVK